MPYKKYECLRGGIKYYCTKNLETGQIIHYTSSAKRKKGIKMREMISHGFVPSYNRVSKKGKPHIVRGYKK